MLNLNTDANNSLQVAPRIFKCFHGKPSVRVRANIKALDLLVKLCKLVKVLLGRTQ